MTASAAQTANQLATSSQCNPATALAQRPCDVWANLGSSEFPLERVARVDEPRLPQLIAIAEGEITGSNEATRSQAIALLSVLPARATSESDAQLLLMVFDIGLRDVPNDLVVKATEEAIRKCKFRPSPGELRAFVEEDLKERKIRLRRLQSNLLKVNEERGGEPQAYCPPDEARRIIEETMGALRA